MDIVEVALSQQEDNPGHLQKTWFITFVTGELRRGKIGILGDGIYVLMHDNTPYYFNADKVVYLYPRT